MEVMASFTHNGKPVFILKRILLAIVFLLAVQRAALADNCEGYDPECEESHHPHHYHFPHHHPHENDDDCDDDD
jgi:hypothetical protein